MINNGKHYMYRNALILITAFGKLVQLNCLKSWGLAYLCIAFNLLITTAIVDDIERDTQYSGNDPILSIQIKVTAIQCWSAIR